ncbi:MAG: glycosyltransferase [Gemmatimonadaceae bacterium]|nr:glycosyltransferase [Gloeobacterales cyanobacterium ES-bin-141]
MLLEPLVSVIIPVYNDLERLQTCLEALEKQTYPRNRYEVIAVDNGSDKSIEPLVHHFSQAIATSESKPGSYAARNKGLSLAKGEIIAFTDADCIPAQNWIERGVDTLLRETNCGLVGGKVEIFFRDASQPTAVELYERLVAFPQQRYVEVERFSVTANLFTSKTVLEKVGHFSDTLKSSGDSDWGKRVFTAGYRLVYADDVRVAHPARHSFNELRKQKVRLVGGWRDRDKRSTSSKIAASAVSIVRDLLPPVGFVSRVSSDKKLKGFVQKSSVVFVHVRVKYSRAAERLRLQLGGESQR